MNMISISPQKANFIAIFLILIVIAGCYTVIYFAILISGIPSILETPSVFFHTGIVSIYPLFFGTIAYIIFYSAWKSTTDKISIMEISRKYNFYCITINLLHFFLNILIIHNIARVFPRAKHNIIQFFNLHN